MNENTIKEEMLNALRTRVGRLTDQLKLSGTFDKKEYIGAMIQAYRVEHNLTQEDLAQRLGVSRMQVLRWESGKHLPGKMAMMLLKTKDVIQVNDSILER